MTTSHSLMPKTLKNAAVRLFFAAGGDEVTVAPDIHDRHAHTVASGLFGDAR